MDHRAFLTSLSATERLALTTPSNRAGLAHLAVHLTALALTSTLILLRVPLWQFILIPQGILLVFLFTLMHEASHKTAFRTPWLNTAIATLCGIVLFLPPRWFRYFHFAHHRHTHDPDHDPELASDKPQTRAAYAWHVTGIPVWKSQLAAILRNATDRANDAYVPAKNRANVTNEARALIALYILLFVTLPNIATLWLIPLLLGQPFLRVYLLAEHARCPHVSDMFENTRTTFANALIRRLAWNMPYHAEHHAMPTVPFHQLPALHAKTQTHLKQTSDGYTAFNTGYVASLTPQ